MINIDENYLTMLRIHARYYDFIKNENTYLVLQMHPRKNIIYLLADQYFNLYNLNDQKKFNFS